MQKQLMAIAPDDLPQYWPEIREEVATIETPDGLIPEDVYGACRQSNATLFFLLVDGTRIGFMVVRGFGTDMHIWQLYAKIGYDVLRMFRPELMELARMANAKKITYGSTRQGWNKVAAQHGFKVRMVIYEAPVDAAPTQAANDDGGADNDKHVTH